MGLIGRARLEWRSASVRRRLFAMLLALVLQALFLLGLLWQMLPPPQATSPSMVTIAINDSPKAEKKAEQKRVVVQKSAAAPQPPLPKPPKPPVESTKAATPSKFVVVSKEELDAGDISKLPSRKGGDSGSQSAAAYGPGEGPGGAQLFRAEWYREPSDAQLELYLPKERPAGSWGEIACQTIAAYHVDNCRTLGESPPGSGISRGLRQAAWQFLVRPPRVNDKPMIGAWVRIHFDFVRGIR